ncbi:rhamnan synthesis F family protein [Streptococcus orisratti]|uniref:rhamnan synthesis F family protein n=1 Tax=Streptococcus orisratti TaxID=114652 RepID=UPI003D02A9DD
MFEVRQNYFAHKLIRGVLRKNEIKKNIKLIEKNKNSRILVILHLFYPKSWKEIQEFLDNLSCYNYDLIVTTTENMISNDVLNQIRKFKPSVSIINCENKGFDLRPFLLALKTVDLKEYDIVIKLQSKSTKRAFLYIYNQVFMRRDWFLDLFEGILSPKVIHNNIDILMNDDSVGLVSTDNLIVHDPWHKVKMVQKTAKENGICVPDDYRFVAGTCFAMKARCLRNIQDFHWTDEHFSPVSNARGMSFAHFFERYICTQVETVWNLRMEGAVVRPVRHAILSIPNKILYRYSSNRLFDENIEFDPEYFYWKLDNKLIKWKYEELPFNKLYYSNGNIRRPFTENEPYRYLKGDIEGYKRYCEYHEINGLPVMSIDRFEALRKSIEEKGYDERHIIIVNSKNELMDGQHRAACLCHQLGEDAKIKVLKIRFIGIRETIKAVIPNFIWERLKKVRDAIKNN